MSTGDWIAAASLALAIVLAVWAAAWSLLGKWTEAKEALRKNELDSVRSATSSLDKTVEKIASKVDAWERMFAEQGKATTAQIHALELVMKDYVATVHRVQTDLASQTAATKERIDAVGQNLDRVVATIIKKIGPQAFLVTSAKKPGGSGQNGPLR